MEKKKKPNNENQEDSSLRTNAADGTDEDPRTCTAELQVKTEETVETAVSTTGSSNPKLALRGSQDSGPITLEEPLHNDGNFRALLRSRARSGDTDLKIHLKTAAMNAQYTSPQIQNELIKICGEKLVQTIVDRCNASQCFSILADETLDVSTSEQLSLSVRYIDVEIGGIREDFIGFVKIHDMTGEGLADIILKTLEKIGLNLQYLCGQSYDGAANMSGHISGAQAIISEKYPEAVYIHCSAHSLNLALAKACSIPAVRNCQGTISSVCNFFRASSIRLELLQKNIKDSFPESRAKSLLPLCETRWVERQDAVLRFVELYSVVVRTLEELKESPLYNSETSSQAEQLLFTVLNAGFVVTIHILRKFLSSSLQLNKTLQRVDVDIFGSLQYVDSLLEKAREMSTDSVKEFQELFDTARSVVESMGGEVRILRICSRQTCQSNIQATSLTPMEYYRLNVAPITIHRGQNLSNIFIKEICKERDYMAHESSHMWCRKWKKIAPAEKPSNALEAYLVCDGQFFPNVKKLLQISATLPVSTATNERSFSTLKRLKTYTRSAMKQERLTGLALLSVHRSLSIEPDFCQSVLIQFSREVPAD
uniref:DUF4371 domain-containing protein n=1 Tax=Anolis carolinensis TaxID=28377 RepID=G1KXM5_ANOCA